MMEGVEGPYRRQSGFARMFKVAAGIFALFILVVVAGALVWRFVYMSPAADRPASDEEVSNQAEEESATEAGLGADIERRRQEASTNAVPTATIVTNPIEDAYTNPFE